MEKEANLARLEDISLLRENWNGNGAPPFNSDLISKASDIIRLLSGQPEIFPTARNSIQIEYESDTEYLEFEVYPDKISVLFIAGNAKEP